MNETPLIDVFWLVFSASLVFLMPPGFMCPESGLTHSKNSINQRFPVDGLKIDRSFISGGAQAGNAKIVHTIMALAKSIGVDVVAEGVEEERQLELLKTANCESAQGFMFSKPLEGQEISQWFIMQN